MNAQRMLSTHPSADGRNLDTIAGLVEAAFDCAQTCTSCADACLAEDMVKDLRYCIRQDLDCADVCDATARILSRRTEPDWTLIHSQVEACRVACKTCGDECEKHAGMHEHCRICAESCRRCEEACRQVLSAIGTPAQA
ncbi:MAG: four-helix bundle copper-binding protein [Rhodothermales bacterium]